MFPESCVLADNLFNGSVPDLGRLASLEELKLGGNKLGPEFPFIGQESREGYLEQQLFEM